MLKLLKERVAPGMGAFDTVQSVLEFVRSHVQFNYAPSYGDLDQGEGDCVSAAWLAIQILQEAFPEKTFRLATANRLPWLSDEFNYSGHCVVIEREPDHLRVIDPTPINGYGYGLISKSIRLDQFDIHGTHLKLRSVQPAKDMRFWEQHIYQDFTILDDSEAHRIASVSNARSQLRTGKLEPGLKIVQPREHRGWITRFWRTKARIAQMRGACDQAIQCLRRAMEVCDNNPYLLDELTCLLPAGHEKTRLSRRTRDIREEIAARHEAIGIYWREQATAFQDRKDWARYLYYLGAAFWRFQSVALLRQEEPTTILTLDVDERRIPLYRFSPAWFRKKGYSVEIAPTRKINYASGLVGGYHLSVDDKGRTFAMNYLGVTLPDEMARVGIVTGSKTAPLQDPLMSHRLFVGLHSPELIIC